ncbi:MAG: helix-turn-helix domain-containing protein [Gemmatimonadales bacterium]
MDQLVSPISFRLQELREGKGLSQAELSRRSGVPQSTISRLEAAETGSIVLANLEKLADALGVNAALLIVHERKGKRG